MALLGSVPLFAQVPLPSFARAAEPAPPAWALDPQALAVRLPTTQLQIPRYSGDPRDPTMHLEMPAAVDRVPVGFGLQLFVRRWTLSIPADRTLDLAGNPYADNTVSEQRRREDWANLRRVALGPDANGSPAAGERSLDRVVGAVGPAGEIRRLVGRQVDVQAEAEIRLSSTRVVGTMPLRAGATMDGDGYRVELIGVRRTVAGPEVLVRQIRYPAFRPTVVGELTFVPADGILDDWAGAALQRELEIEALPGFGLHAHRAGGPRGSPWGTQWQAVWQVLVASGRDTAPTRDTTSLLVIETRYAGRVTRTLRADDVAIVSADRSAAQR